VTRDEAFNILGLYLGASDEHIRAKHAAKRQAVETTLAGTPAASQQALQTELARLDEALAVASGKAPESSAVTQTEGIPATVIFNAAPATPRRSRGWIVVVALLIGLCGYYVTTKFGMWFFDKEHQQESTPEVIADAELASVAWLTYLSRSGQPETAEGRKASEALNKGAGARAAGDLGLAQREYNTAWQAFFNAFKAEAARADAAWKDEVVTPWREKLQPFYPFDPRSTKDALVSDLAPLVNPKDGKLWSHSRWFDALAVVDIKGTKFFSLPKGRAEFMVACSKLRDCLFAPDADRLWVPFSARIMQGRVWGKITFEVGRTTGTSERDGQMEAFSWRGDNGGCVLKAYDLSGRKERDVIDRSNSSWGLLRILAECKYVGLIENAHTWEITAFEQALPGAKKEAPTLQIMVDRKPSPFDLSVYAAAKLE